MAQKAILESLSEPQLLPPFNPRFLEIFHVDIQTSGRTLSLPWSRQPNDVMSEIRAPKVRTTAQ